jgi:hypothetical protein
MTQLHDAVREAIEKSGKSRYRIAQDTGIDESLLSKVVRGHAGLSFANLAALLEYLDLEIVLRPRRSKTDGKYKSR